MMSREEFVASRKHKMMGMMLDCFMNGHRKGAEASLWLSMIQSQVIDELNRMYDSLQPKPAAMPVKPQETAANGKPTGTAAGVQPGGR